MLLGGSNDAAEAAERQADVLVKNQPSNWLARATLGLARLRLGRKQDALAAIREPPVTGAEPPGALAVRAAILAANGYEEGARNDARLVSGLRSEISERRAAQESLSAALVEVEHLKQEVEAENSYLRRELIAINAKIGMMIWDTTDECEDTSWFAGVFRADSPDSPTNTGVFSVCVRLAITRSTSAARSFVLGNLPCWARSVRSVAYLERVG